jgi:DNA repair protein RecN (Recombination protein N)
MLSELSVENFALVEKVRLSFRPGLNILTGETGAGKSILLDALGMVLGERTGGDSVRHGADRARVEAVFTVDDTDERLREALETAGVEAEDGVLILSRELTAAGKGSVRINGRPATVGMLKGLGDALVDIHGQHEHQSLLAVERHADILDAWCGPDALALKAAVAEAHRRVSEARRELEALQQDARERARTLDLLGFQRDEIDAAKPEPREEEELMAERLRLAGAERLFEAASGAYAALHGGAAPARGGKLGLSASGGEGGGALDLLSTAVAEVEHAAKIDERLTPLLESLQNALYVAEDAAREVRAYRDEIEFNPERLEEIEARLDTLKTLKRKYGDTLEEVLRYREEIGTRLETLENAEERIAALQGEVDRAQGELDKRAAKLTTARKKAAEPFAKAIMKELADLAMTATRFSVAVEPRPATARGADHVEFLISPNPGVPLKPLAKIASGGEISRVMLAMKSVLSRTLSVPTLIFDEIDTGIGGRTGTVLGEKLHALSAAAQILCITHLPQIAARGDHHFQIEKTARKDRTEVRVASLTPDDRVGEIARMLGGEASDTVLQHAREMLAAK